MIKKNVIVLHADNSCRHNLWFASFPKEIKKILLSDMKVYYGINYDINNIRGIKKIFNVFRKKSIQFLSTPNLEIDLNLYCK